VDRREIVAMIHYHTAISSRVSGNYHTAMAEQLCAVLTEFDQCGRLRHLVSYRR
jgi:hypothetical protein